jgi:hypothetical protein
MAVIRRTLGALQCHPLIRGNRMQMSRAIVVTAIGLSMLSVTACGNSPRPVRAGSVSASPSKVAVNLPTKDQLANDYLTVVTAYNDVMRKSWPQIEAGTTLAKGKGIGSDMATANWTKIEKFRALRKSIEVPDNNYPTDKAFYTDLHTSLGQAIDKSLHMQELWTRLRDATTAAEFDEALEDPSYKDDGATQRRLRSLLGLPDIPQS